MLVAKNVNTSTKHSVKNVKDLEKGKNKKAVAAKDTLQKNTLSVWVKSKEKLLNSLEKKATLSDRN